jgi:response regulator RpfG family c-di-GMP phosphodiesterase
MPRAEETDVIRKPTILHVSTRDVLRPVRDQILRVNGYEVISCDTYDDALTLARINPVDLILIDVESEWQVREAERLCSALKSDDPAQRVAFVCNWRVAILNECPDDVVRSEFDPIAFVNGVGEALRS